MERSDLLHRLARESSSSIVLLVLDGVGGLRNAEQPRTALEMANLPNLDDLARRSALGRIDPVSPGITPGSGPGHLALFGYDPTSPEADIGRGVLEALGLGLALDPTTVAARGNFATADASGNLTDRRAGRPTTEECRRLCGLLREALDGAELDIEIELHAAEGHRFVLLLRGDGLLPELADTDPQRLGVPPLELEATSDAAQGTADRLRPAIEIMEEALAAEPKANRLLLRGFSKLPDLPPFPDTYRLRAGAFAGYPLYRGVAAACGMDVVDCGKRFGEIVSSVAEHRERYDYFFLHVKQTDQAGEDGNAEAKAAALEEVDAALPDLLALEPDVLAITGDHSTPAVMRSHSWHPVPLMIHSRLSFVDAAEAFTEQETIQGALGTLRSQDLMGLLMAHAGRLAKFGA